MTLKEMVRLNDKDMKAEIDASVTRVKKLNEEVAGSDEKANTACPYYNPENVDEAENCEMMACLYCKIGACPND